MSNSNGCSNESCWKFVAKSNYGPRKKQVLLSSDSEIMLHICCFDVIYSLAKLLRPELRAPRRYVRGRNWKLTPIGQGATFALTQLTYGFCVHFRLICKRTEKIVLESEKIVAFHTKRHLATFSSLFSTSSSAKL